MRLFTSDNCLFTALLLDFLVINTENFSAARIPVRLSPDLVIELAISDEIGNKRFVDPEAICSRCIRGSLLCGFYVASDVFDTI